MGAVINWVRRLIFIILFTTLLEMFLPDSNLRKYVRVVLGLFIISILIAPLTSILGENDFSSDYIIPERLMQENWEEVKEKGEEIKLNSSRLMNDYYSDRVREHIKEVVNIYCDDYKKIIQVELDDHYRLKSVEVVLISRNIEQIEIEPVEIYPEKKDNISRMSEGVVSIEELEVKNTLREKLSQVFQLNKKQIKITFKREGE